MKNTARLSLAVALSGFMVGNVWADCEHAVYSLKKKTLTVPFIEIPVVDFFSGQPTGDVELWTGSLKQLYGVTNRFRLLSKTVARITDGSSSDCPATYTQSGMLFIPYVDVPTGIVVGNKKFEGEVKVIETTLMWEPLGRSFVVQNIQKLSGGSAISKSCLEIKVNDPSAKDGIYKIDPDGNGGTEPFEVYCDMTHEGGGWTLYAYHADGIANVQTQELVKPTEYAVMTSSHWLAVRDNMTTGMMFLDEQGRISTISASKLKNGNCISIQQVSDLSDLANNVVSSIWHNENSGCSASGRDYSLIQLAGKKYSSFGIAGAALEQDSSLKFDKWPYQGTFSYDQQNTLLYFIK